MKKYAVIDIGTNSMRLLLATIENYGDRTPDQSFSIEKSISHSFIERKKYINTTRIGNSVNKNKVISKEGIKRNIEAFYDFTQQAKEYGAEKILAIATSAVRDAKNGNDFIQAVYQKTGVKIKTISGEEEAELGYKGVIMGIKGHSGDGPSCVMLPNDTKGLSLCVPVLVIDIGGGSTELILGTRHGDIKKTLSLDMGAVRMTERFITTNPVNKKEYEEMETEIYRIVRDGGTGQLPHLKYKMRHLSCPPVPKPECHSGTDGMGPMHEKFQCHSEPVAENSFSAPPVSLTTIGIGGTITTLAALHQELDPYDPEKTHNYKLTPENINDLKEKLLSLTIQQIKQLKGIHPKRADIIIAGITILSIIMNSLDLREIIISEYDNLEGMLYKLLPTY